MKSKETKKNFFSRVIICLAVRAKKNQKAKSLCKKRKYSGNRLLCGYKKKKKLPAQKLSLRCKLSLHKNKQTLPWVGSITWGLYRHLHSLSLKMRTKNIEENKMVTSRALSLFHWQFFFLTLRLNWE